MSRGPGKWQRLILQTLQAQEAIYLCDLLPRTHTRSAYMAVLRAVHTLEDRGSIRVQRYAVALYSFDESHLLLTRPGLTIDRLKFNRSRQNRLSVSTVSSCSDANTYTEAIDVEFQRI